jgi:hypothetical protein
VINQNRKPPLKKEVSDNRKTYEVVQDKLPIHYKLNTSAKQWKDKKIIFDCKVKIDYKIDNPNYLESLLIIHPECYIDIVKKIARGKMFLICKPVESIKVLVNHELFNKVPSEDVHDLLCECYCYAELVDGIITKHDYFRKFD